MLSLIAATQGSIVDFNGVLTYKFDHPVGAKQDSTFVHKKCFNTFGEPSGLALTTSQRISMVEGFSFDGRATLALTTFALPADDNIPASCATAGILTPEFDGIYYDLKSCGLATVTERLKVCAAICTHVNSCVAGEVSTSDGIDLTRCALHGGDGFERVLQLPGACRERPALRTRPAPSARLRTTTLAVACTPLQPPHATHRTCRCGGGGGVVVEVVVVWWWRWRRWWSWGGGGGRRGGCSVRLDGGGERVPVALQRSFRTSRTPAARRATRTRS